MENNAVGPEFELGKNGRYALPRCPGGSVGDPLFWYERLEVFEFAGSRPGIEGSSETLDKIVTAEPFEHNRVPVVHPYQQVAVPLKVAGQSAHRLFESDILGDMVSYSGEYRPHANRQWIAPRLFGTTTNSGEFAVACSLKNV